MEAQPHSRPACNEDDERGPFKLQKDLSVTIPAFEELNAMPSSFNGCAGSDSMATGTKEARVSEISVPHTSEQDCAVQHDPLRKLEDSVTEKPVHLKLEDLQSRSCDDNVKCQAGDIVIDTLSKLGSQNAGVKPEMLKTSLCSFFRKKNTCRHGESCRYAHGESELRPRPDGSWDPTSERAKFFSGECHSKEQNEDGQHEDEDDFFVPEDNVGVLRKCIVDVPLQWSSEDLKSFLTEQGVAFCTTKKRKRFQVGFVEFENDEQIALAKQKLDGMRVHSRLLKVADVLPRAWENKRVRNQAGVAGDVECTRLDMEATAKSRNICDVVTPLAKMPYEQQLEKKSDEIARVLKKLVRNVRKALSPDAPLPDWITDSRHKGGLPCSFHGIVASPVVDGYRNKCEFTVGCSLDGKRVVGFLLGNFREGLTAVEEPSSCRNVSAIARLYAAAFQEFIQKSELPVWDKASNTGFWRLFTVREGRAASNSVVPASGGSSIAEVMLIVQVCTAGVEEDIRAKEYARMAQDLAVAASLACPPLFLPALIVQDHLGISNAASPDSPLLPIPLPEVLLGSVVEGNSKDSASFIHDHICNLRFRLSATAFFQVNTLAAEKLYTLVGDWAGLSCDTLVFDVCCGTGTIGLTLAHRVGMVIGIEANESAVADARTNAEINGINNCQFICAKAEDVMDSLLEEYFLCEEKTQADEFHKVSSEKLDKLVSGVGHPPGGINLSGVEATREMECSEIEAMPTNADDSKENSGGSLEADSETLSVSAPRRKFKNVVVIVDPPRSGLHPVVVRVLRTHGQIHRLVYVSCNPETLLANAVELCTPTASQKGETRANKAGSGGWRRSMVGHARHRMKSMPVSKPFRPVKAMAVDLFPHTPHCEVVMLMER